MIDPCPICTPLGWDHEAVRAECRASLYQTAVRLCRWERMAHSRFHKGVCDWLQKSIENGDREILLMLARDFLKTSTLAALCVWGWINNAELRILLVHASSEISSKLVAVVQDILQNDAMKHFFPEIVPDPRKVTWNKGALEIVREGNYAQASLEAWGVGSSLEGAHYDWQLFDDIVDRKASRSAVEMDEVQSFFKHAPSLFDSPQTELQIVTGTLWPGGFYEGLYRSGDYKCLILGAECNDRYRNFTAEMGIRVPDSWVDADGRKLGTAVWPKWFSAARLEKRIRRMGWVNYCRQMRNEEALDEEQMFGQDMFSDQFYYVGERNMLIVSEKRRYKIEDCELYATVDPSGGETKRADETAINVTAFYRPLAYAFVLEEVAGRWLPQVINQKILEVIKKWKPFGLRRVGIEETACQSWLKHYLRQEMTKQNAHCVVEPLKIRGGQNSKEARIIQRFQPFVANGQVFFLRSQRELIREMTALRVVDGQIVGRSPNRLDALAWQIHFWGVAAGDEGQPYDPDDESDSRPIKDYQEYREPYGLACAT